MDIEVTLTAVSANDPSCDLYMLTETLERYTSRSKRSRREAEEAETRRAYGGLG